MGVCVSVLMGEAIPKNTSARITEIWMVLLPQLMQYPFLLGIARP